MKSNLKKIILDFIPAFLGVLIALILSNWKDQRKENEFLQKSIIGIYNDNVINLQSINSQIYHFEKHIDTIKHYCEAKNLRIIDILGKNDGFQSYSIKLPSWNILQNSPSIIKIDYKLLSLLTEMNDNVETLEAYNINVSNILYNSLESNDKNDKNRIFVLIKDYENTSLLYKNNAVQLDSFLVLNYRQVLKSHI